MGGWVDKQMQKMYFASYILLLDLINDAKRAQFGQNRGQKYKIGNFEASNAFGVFKAK